MNQPLAPGELFIKVSGEDADMHKIGATGRVVSCMGCAPDGSIGSTGEDISGEYGYFVRFDEDPLWIPPIFIRGKKIAKAKDIN